MNQYETRPHDLDQKKSKETLIADAKRLYEQMGYIVRENTKGVLLVEGGEGVCFIHP